MKSRSKRPKNAEQRWRWASHMPRSECLMMNLGNKLSRRRKDDPGSDRDDQRKRSPASSAQASSSAASSSAGSRISRTRTETTGGAGSATETGARMITDNYRDLMRSGTGGRRKEKSSHASSIGGASGGGGIGNINPRRRSNDRGSGTMRSSASNGGGSRDGGYRRRSSNEEDGYLGRQKSSAPPASAASGSSSAPSREAARPRTRENMGECGVPGHHRQARQNVRTREGGRRLSGDHGGGSDTGTNSSAAGRTAARRSIDDGDEPTNPQQPHNMGGGTVLLRRSSADSDAGESGSNDRKPRYMKRRERGSQQQQQQLSSSMDLLSNPDDYFRTSGQRQSGPVTTATKPDVAKFHASMPTSSLIGDFPERRRASNEGATSKHYFSARPANGSAASSAIKPGAVAVSGKAPDAQELEAKKQAAAVRGRRSSADTTDDDGFDDLDDNGESSDPITEMRALKDTHISRTNELLFDVFPAHVARALRDGRKVEPEEKEMCTIFFSDIVGYTDLVSRLLTPIQVSDLLDRLYSEFDDISEFHGVHKMETIGDAWMGVTNLVRPQDSDHCRRIALFARDVISVANKNAY